MTLHRFVANFLGALGVAWSISPTRSSAAIEREGDVAAEIAALLAAQPKWSVSASLDASYGYRDNLLLSHAGEERSAFARGVAELVLLRVPTGRFEYTFFAQGERTRFFEGETVEHEAKAWAQTEIGYRIGDTLRVGLPVTGYYSDQVFDVSETDVERYVAELTVLGGMVGPVVRWSFLPSWWFEAQATGERKRYDDGSNDGTVGEGAVRLGWIHGERFEAGVEGAQRWRNYDRRARYNTAGREIPGTELKISERELQVRFDVAWDQARRWQTTTRASLLHYRDNGSGYFNYREQRVQQELEWENEGWLVRIDGAASRIDFGVQTVGIGVAPPARLKDEFSAELRLERKLSRRWTLLAAYTWERSRSNDTIASYRVNEGLLGMRWSWEK